MSSVDLSEFVSGFLAEADEHLRSVNANLLLVDAALQKGVPNARAVGELFRSLHTIKGLAGMVGVEPIVDIAHGMERVLRIGQQNAGRIPGVAFEPLLQGTNAIAQRVRSLAEGKPVATAPVDLIALLAAVESEQVSVADSDARLDLDEAVLSKLNASEKEQLSGAISAGKRAFQVPFVPSAERAAKAISITSVRQSVSRIAEIVKVVPTSTKETGGTLCFLLLVVTTDSERALADAAHCLVEELRVISKIAVSSPVQFESDSDGATSGAPGVLRVDVRRVDATLEGLAGLLVTKFRLARAVEALAKSGVDVRELRQITNETTRQLRDMRGAILGLRMVSLAELFDRLPILVRGLRAATGKTVELSMNVGRIEVDKGVGERIWPVLVHLVRNAVDHGMENEAERTRAGKPAHGKLLVTCEQTQSSHVQLVIADDGGGIDAERVAKRAGKPIPEDDAGLLELITTPGFSTRDVANATSGRGMGLDIVRRTIVEELGGELKLSTSKGSGTRFTLKVPITVALVDTFRFECDAQQFLVPVASVEELVDVEAKDVMEGPGANTARVRVVTLYRRGIAMPLVELSAMLGGPARRSSPKAIIVRRNEQYFAFGVDRLIDHHEVVVRPLTDPLVSVPGITGSTDLGDGRPTLLLDLVALANKLSELGERAA